MVNIHTQLKSPRNPELDMVGKWNKCHKEFLANSTNAGCYYCCCIFPASDIKEWVKSSYKRGEKDKSPNDCAICPRCGIDSVLPDLKVVLSVPFLREMHDYFFEF